MKVLNSILNFLWRIISFTGILFAGMILIVVGKDHMVDWAFRVASICILITVFGFGFWQATKKQDDIKIIWKVKKDDGLVKQ